MYQLSIVIDNNKIHPHACLVLLADLSAGETGLITPPFGYTPQIQPDEPVTKVQTAAAIRIVTHLTKLMMNVHALELNL